MIRVVNVSGLRGPAREGVVYVGRAFAGWPQSFWHNPFKPAPGVDAVAMFRELVERNLAERPDVTERELAALWEATGRGAKPLGCWCSLWIAGVSPPEPEFCHAIVVAKLLVERFRAKVADQPAGA